MKKELLKLKTEEDIQKFAKKAGLKFSSVERYVREAVARAKKTGKMYIALLFPDLHYPLFNEPSWNAVKKFIPYIKPQEEDLLGDAMDMSALNPHEGKRLNIKYFEGKRLLKEYEGFIKDILEPLEQLAPKAKRVYLGGNHEEWAYQMVEKFPQLEGMIEPEIALKLKERGWEWIPYLIKRPGEAVSGMHKIGKLTLTHGQYLNIYHAAKMASVYDKSVVYGHTHDIQMFTKVHAEDPDDFHTAQSIGCLCNLSPRFIKGRASKWVNAFGVLYVQPDGKYNLYVPIIIDGRFTFNGIVFDGNK